MDSGPPATLSVTSEIRTGVPGKRVWSGEKSDTEDTNQGILKVRLPDFRAPHSVDGGEWLAPGRKKE